MCAFRQNPTPELQLTLDRADSVYRPGEVVGITVAIQPERDLKLGVMMALVGAPVFLHLIWRTQAGR